MYKILLTLAILITIGLNIIQGCTSIIISGKYTVDGRPLMWKNRDSDNPNNKLMYFKDGKFSYIGLVDSDNKSGSEIWAGYNSAGLCIMNTASYNLNIDTVDAADQEGVFMKWAMMYCRNIKDFQNMLDTMAKPYPVEANFGLIDAEGGAMYFEVSNFGYKIYDANDKMVAPMGYLIRTNFSFSGRVNEGSGYERYIQAEEIFYRAAGSNLLNPQYIIQEASRCLTHGITKINLKSIATDESETKMVDFRDFIPRSFSTSAVVFQGIKSGENPNQTIMWTLLGFPLASVAYPVFINDAGALPAILKADLSGNAPICSKALKLKELCFPVIRGNGENYLNINALYNKQNTGIVQKLRELENQILKASSENIGKWRKSLPQVKEIQSFYQSIDNKILSGYKQLFDL